MIKPYAEQAQSDVRMDVSMTVNGSLRTLRAEPRMTLLDALRDELALTGPKKSCDRGECGACTVHIEGRRVLSCMTLAAMHDGQGIATIEGLECDGQLHPVQQMFIEHDGFQCGFCTSGQIMSAVAMICRRGTSVDAVVMVPRRITGSAVWSSPVVFIVGPC